MLATLVQTLPVFPANWSCEFKWDGVRAITYWDGRTLRMQSRNLLPIEHRYPDLMPLAKQLGRRRAVLDGEIIAVDEEGRPSFTLLQRRMLLQDARNIARLSVEVPVVYMVFDLLHLDGRSTMELPWCERRALLERLKLASDRWGVSPLGEGAEMLQIARVQQLEGVVLKAKDSPYVPGQRGRNWLKLKLVNRQEFVIGGWVPEGGTNTLRVGAILVGYYDAGRLLYAGGVGTGFDAQWHAVLAPRLAALEQAQSPFAVGSPPRKAGVRWVRPVVVAEIEYRRWPTAGSLQQAAFKGIREDKHPGGVVYESK